ncbi:class I tRNA ligase family protein [Candidatus Parcubacteria bacterium]|nr:class I tRNA ligase family protein [Candidatus Parcubacteria bacterium]
MEERLKKFILTFWNSFSFFKTYAPSFHPTNKIPKKLEILDKWIISRLYNLIQNVTQKLENYDITQAARLIDFFVIEDLSLWYIRRSRKRFQKPKNKKELILASQVLGYVLLNLSKILAPFLPFLADYVWHEISNLKFKSQKSVHLEDWPKFEKKLVDFQLEKEMEKAREVVRLALAERARAKIKVRQPLKLLQIPQKELVTKEELLELIKEEVNVKEITFGEKLFLDTTLTPELLKEGIIREIMRHIQAMRKEMGLQPKEKVIVQYEGDERLKEVIRENKDYILKEANIEDIFEKKMKKVFDLEKEIDIDGKKIILAIKKIT